MTNSRLLVPPLVDYGSPLTPDDYASLERAYYYDDEADEKAFRITRLDLIMNDDDTSTLQDGAIMFESLVLSSVPQPENSKIRHGLVQAAKINLKVAIKFDPAARTPDKRPSRKSDEKPHEREVAYGEISLRRLSSC